MSTANGAILLEHNCSCNIQLCGEMAARNNLTLMSKWHFSEFLFRARRRESPCVIVEGKQITVMIASCHVTLAVPFVLGRHFMLSTAKQMNDVTRQTVRRHAPSWGGAFNHARYSILSLKYEKLLAASSTVVIAWAKVSLSNRDEWYKLVWCGGEQKCIRYRVTYIDKACINVP
jgi:hypothetical protein